jgi:hypothetical protein
MLCGLTCAGVHARTADRGTRIAVKMPRHQEHLRDDQIEAFNDEAKLCAKLRNPFIVNFVGASHVPNRLCLVRLYSCYVAFVSDGWRASASSCWSAAACSN